MEHIGQSKIEGIDESIKISLREYGMGWVDHKNEITFFYGIKFNENGYYKFDFCSFPKNMDVKDEFSWVEWDEVYSFCGVSQDEFHIMSLPCKIYDLLMYYGFENIFGTSYGEGLNYNEIISKVKESE